MIGHHSHGSTVSDCPIQIQQVADAVGYVHDPLRCVGLSWGDPLFHLDCSNAVFLILLQARRLALQIGWCIVRSSFT